MEQASNTQKLLEVELGALPECSCDDDDDDDDGSLPGGRFIGFYTIRGWDESGGFPLPSSQTIMGEQLIQGHYSVAWGMFEPATLLLQDAEHTYRYTTMSHM